MPRLQNLLILLLLAIQSIRGQGVFSNETTVALQKVIQDYPNRFENIRGAVITSYPEATDYQSTVEIPGAVNAVISHYKASNKELYSWKSTVFVSESFEDASRQYTELFNQIRNTIIKIEGEKPFILIGTLQKPMESRRSTSTQFQLYSAASVMQQLKVVLTVEHAITEWRIQLSVYDNVTARPAPVASVTYNH
jgi:hypothetical protein